VAIADLMTGMYSAVAILAALHERHASGRGQYIDMALLDTQVAVLANQAMNYLVSGETPRRLGNAHPNIAPYQTFQTADGHIIIAVGNDAQFRRLCELLGLAEIGGDSRFSTNADRVRGREALSAALSLPIGQRKRDDLLALFSENGIPAGPINSVAEVFSDPQVIARGLRRELGGIPTVVSPIVIDGKRQMAERPSPVLDEEGDAYDGS
jgi:crotonobetainyl-CoA:carnitine CoA-transferase CaiB-like acyl-CoA transferase